MINVSTHKLGCQESSTCVIIGFSDILCYNVAVYNNKIVEVNKGRKFMSKKAQTVLVIVVVLIIAAVRIFWQGPAKSDLTNLLNKNNEVINANTKIINDELGKFSSYTSVGQYQVSIETIIVPKINESIQILQNTELKTEEGKALRQEYIQALETYKQGVELALTALQNNDMAKLNEVQTMFTQANSGIASFNKHAQELADKYHLNIVVK